MTDTNQRNDKNIISNKRHGRSNFGEGVRQVIPGGIRAIDPFVFLDHYGPFEKQPGWEGVAMHPHAGIATVTYLLSGTNHHADSYGHEVLMETGDLAWMVAGKGIEHSEGRHPSEAAPETSHGVQFWVSLPAADKFTEPDFTLHRAASLPRIRRHGVDVTVVAGSLMGETSPAAGHSHLFIYDLAMSHDSIIDLDIPEGQHGAVYSIAGEIEVSEQDVREHHIASFSSEGDSVTIRSANGPARVIVFGGTALNEPIVSYASFVMNSEEQIHRVVDSYQRGEMRIRPNRR